jgi:cytochrome b
VSSSGRIRVWDLPTRIFHWTLAALVTFSFTTGKIGGGWVDWHMKSGYAILALLLFRLAWGLIGSDTARFSHFVRGPRAALAHGRHALAGRHGASLGHNPLGGWMVLAMLAILLAQAASGLFVDDEIANQGPLAAKVSNALVARMSALHSWNQWAIAAAVALHVLAIAAYGFALRVNLVSPMVHGWTAVPEGLRPPDPRHSHPGLALGLLAACAAFVYWLVVVYPKG